MTKKEFEKIIGMELTPFDYELVETVYTWHPSISNENGKQEMATLYRLGGIRIIKDMYPTAKCAMNIQHQKDKMRGEMEYLDRQYQALKEGYCVDEKFY